MIKNLTVKLRTRLFVILTIFAVVFLILVAPIMFNFKNFFRIGMFSVEDEFTKEYSDGTGGFNAVLSLQYLELEFYAIQSEIKPISSGDVINYGFLSIQHTFFKNDVSRKKTTLLYDPPGDRFSNQIRLYLSLHDNLTIRGQVEVQCFVNGTTLTNETISYQISFDIPINIEDMSNIDLMIYALFFIYFISIPVVPFILSFIFRPVFGVDFGNENLDKNRKFVRYLSEMAKEKRKENNNSGPK